MAHIRTYISLSAPVMASDYCCHPSIDRLLYACRQSSSVRARLCVYNFLVSALVAMKLESTIYTMILQPRFLTWYIPRILRFGGEH